MPRTTGDKCKAGLEYISELSSEHVCKSFSGGNTTCTCIINYEDKLPQVKSFFETEVKEFWKVPSRLAVCMDGPAIGKLFGEYLYPFCSFASQRAGYIFPIAGQDMIFCLPTMTKIFGLGQHAHAAARKVLIDKKAIGLNLLKNACFFNIRHDPEHKTLYRFYRSIFNYQVVPVSHNNPESVRLIEYVLGGRIVHLNEDSNKAVDFMLEKYHPFYEDLTAVTNGGDNIKYGPPAKPLPDWGSFDKKPQLKPFINQVGEAVRDMWGGNESLEMKYETVFIFSELSGTRDNIPQKAHADIHPKITMKEKDTYGAKSCIAVTPINPDGMMIVVWTDGRPRKYRNEEQIKADHARLVKEDDVTPGQYFLYIPKGVFLALPADTIHAGGLCFGSKMKCPTKSKKMKGKEVFFQNQRLHFTFCCSEMAVKQSGEDATITIYGDNRKPFDQDFVADKKVMDKLFEYVLDRHPNFMPTETQEMSCDSDDDIIVATLKRQEKVPKGHVRTYKKN